MTRRRFEMDTVISAARELLRDTPGIRFIRAGDGDELPGYRAQAQDCGNVIFPGWLNAAQIQELLARAHLGLVPYRNTPDLVISVPNKVGEYLAAGVPVATCLEGTLARLLSRRRCGVSFEASNPASFANMLRQLRADEPQRRTLSANARLAYREELAAETVYRRLIERLEQIAAQAREPQRARINADRVDQRT